jgi:short-subunit dehydrogenase
MNRAIIIGATSGIGKELAMLLVRDGFKVGITGRREILLNELHSLYPDQFTKRSFDISSADNSIELSGLVRQLGGLDLLILSSGTGDLNEELDFEIERKTIDTNVIGFTEIIDWSYQYFQKQKYGHIVAISSIAGIKGGRNAPSYNATKAYQINYLEGIRQKAHKQKLSIYVTDIRPGFVDTDMAKGEGKFWVASKGKAAQQIYSLIKRKKPVGYITKRWKIFALMLKILPTWIHKRL